MFQTTKQFIYAVIFRFGFQMFSELSNTANGCRRLPKNRPSRDIQRIGWVAYLLNGHATGTD